MCTRACACVCVCECVCMCSLPEAPALRPRPVDLPAEREDFLRGR